MKRVFQWWLGINLNTRLMAVTTLCVSLLMSSLTFWALTIIQKDSIVTDSRFGKDISLLFASNIIDLVDQDNYKELTSFIEKVYLSTSSIRYVQIFKIDGTIYMALPFYNHKIQRILQLYQNVLQVETQDFLFNIPVINYSSIFRDYITNVTLPLIKNGKSLGTLCLGINPNPSILSASRLIKEVSIAVFVSIWLMVVIGAAFNALIITEPIKELLFGLKSIASGNFRQHITSSFDGELGNLIISFNEMAKRLESYEEKNVEQLASEKNKLETLVSTIVDGAILVDIELRLLFVNQAAIKIFGWTNKDIIGRLIFHHLPLHVSEGLLPILNNMIKANCLENHVPKAEEMCVKLNYNSTKTLRFLLNAVLDNRRKMLTGVAITIQDITREVQLNEAKNQFISNVSHELRTPLCNIGSFLETLLDYNGKLDHKQRIQFLTIAYNETQRLTRLVNDVLDLSRLEVEHQYVLKPVDLIEVISNTIQASHIMALNRKVKVIVECSRCIKYVFANEIALCQVLSNLVSNALKFTYTGGRIIIRVYPLPFIIDDKQNKDYFDSVRVEVVDEGIGMDKTVQKQIFDRFMRIENNVHTFRGTGLGLSIVKNIIEKHHSSIAVYGELKVGASFWFDLTVVNITCKMS
uniref:Uncharacterized sensor-like histidine kinase ycf26 n=1 Tax=Rhodogorgon sp. TaxID=2485824 RepID=A0A3G3MI85_9FLOR|nr:two component sensor kinase [Rhodogorgon sp.]